MKIIFTCVGRRVELIQAFHAAADRLGLNLLIYGVDSSNTAPAMFFCDRKVSVCRIGDPAYITDLLSICQQEEIDALIPTIDTDLLLLAQNKTAFTEIGTNVVISKEDSVLICRDKRLTYAFFKQCGLKAPMTVDSVAMYRGGFPCFIKPLDGSASINAFRAETQMELDLYASMVSQYVIQPFIDGVEYTVDAFCDFEGHPLLITPRVRLIVRSGEVIKTQIVQDERIISECKAIIEAFKPCGAITIQLIRQKQSGEDFFIEINPRFGGGAPLSIKAGADSAELLLRLLAKEIIAYQQNAALDGAMYSRFDQSICVRGGRAPEVRAIVFDLDDTLYLERDYVRSGYRAVANTLPSIPNAYEKLLSAFEEGRPAIDILLNKAGIFSDRLMQNCIAAYRSHQPDIKFSPGIRKMLIDLRLKGIKLGILTDGRPEGQRKKINALGLNELVDEIIVTDELGGVQFRKPNDIAFRVIQRRLAIPFAQMLYVSDNPKKDFTAPIALGMQTLHYANPDGLYNDTSTEENPQSGNILTPFVINEEELIKCLLNLRHN